MCTRTITSPRILICILSFLLKSRPDRSGRQGKDVDMWENATVSPGCTPRKLLGGQGVARSTSGLSQAPGSHRLWWQPPCQVMQKYWEWKQRRPDRPHPALAYVPVLGPAGRRAGVHSLGRGHLNVEGSEGPRGPRGAFQKTWPFLSGASPEMLGLSKVTAQGRWPA